MLKLLWLTVVTVVWVGTAAKLLDLRADPGNRGLRWLCAALVSLALSVTLQIPVVHTRIDSLTALNTAGTLSNCLTLVAVLAAQSSFLHMAHPGDEVYRKTRFRAWSTALAVVAILALSATTGSNYAESLAARSTEHQIPVVSAHGYVYVVFLGVITVGMIGTAWTYSRMATWFCLRNGLRLLALGGVFTVAYTCVRFVAMVSWQLDSPVPGTDGNLIGYLFTTAIMLTLIGAALPAWGPRLGLERLGGWLALNRTYRSLYPLWVELYRAVPSVALDPHAGRVLGRVRLRDVGFAVYRRIIEIWDARLHLRSYLAADVERLATELGTEAGLDEARLAAVVEASALAVGVRAKQRGITATEAGSATATPDPEDMAAATNWLTEVSAAFATSPVVKAVVREMESRWSEEPTLNPR